MPQQPNWFAQNAPPAPAQPPPATDWFAQHAPPQQQQAPPPTDTSPSIEDQIVSGIKSLWAQVNPAAGARGIVTALSHPVATAQGYSEAQNQLFNASRESFSKGDTINGVRHGLNYLLNGIPGLGSSIESAQNQGLSGDYGGMVGSSMGLGLQTALPFRGQGPKIGPASAFERPAPIDPVAAIMPGAGTGRARLLRAAQRVAPTAEARGLIGSSPEITAGNLDQAMANATEDLAKAKQSIPADRGLAAAPAIAALREKIRGLTVNGQVPSGNKAAVDQLLSTIDDIKSLGAEGNFEDWAKIRDSAYAMADAAGTYAKTPSEVVAKQAGKAAAEAGGIIADHMAKGFPEIAAPNAEFSFIKNLKTVVDAARSAQTLRDTRFPAAARPTDQAMAALSKIAEIATAGKIKIVRDLAEAISTANRGETMRAVGRASAAAGLTSSEANALLARLISTSAPGPGPNIGMGGGPAWGVGRQ
jgi:hypothetical protein